MQGKIKKILETRIYPDCDDGYVEIEICGIPEAVADIMDLWKQREEEVRKEATVQALMAIGDVEDERLYGNGPEE